MSKGLGIVGAGGVAQLHADAAAKFGLPVVGVCDVDGARAESLAAGHAGAFATTELDELLASPAIGAVVVATPNVFHKPAAIAALRAGKHILLEKPMAMNVAECDEIIAAARASNRLVQMGFVCRGAPAAVEAARVLATGVLGRIFHVKASFYRRRGIPGLGRWFTNRAQSGGGALMDVGVHLIDLVLFLIGFPRATRASCACTATFGHPIERYAFEEMWGGPPDPDGVFDVEDAAAALVRFAGGMTMELNVTWAADVAEGRLRDGVVLLGDTGGCVVDLWGNELIVTTEQGGRLVDSTKTLTGGEAWAAAWRRQAEVFARNVREGTPPEASATQGRAVQVLIDALYRSAAEGREVGVGE